MLTALATALLVASSDTAAPVITHTAIETAARDRPLHLRATISDESGVFDAVLFWRPLGEPAFTGVNLERLPDGTFLGTLPVALVRAQAVEYYLQAYDELGNGPANVGTAEAPLRVALTDAPSPSASPLPAATAASPDRLEEGLPVAPLVVTGAGAAMTVVGAVMWFVAAGSMGELNARYPPGVGLRPADLTAARTATANSRIASGLMMGGAAATAGGLTWWLLTPGGGQEELMVGAGGRF